MRRVRSVTAAVVLVVILAPAARAASSTLTTVPAWEPLPAWALPLVGQLSFGWALPHASLQRLIPPPPGGPASRGYPCLIAGAGSRCDPRGRAVPIVLL